MDGLKDTVPLGKPYEKYRQLTLLDISGIEKKNEDTSEAVLSRIFNWRSKFSLPFIGIKEMYFMPNKLFDYVIGNPPYQEQTEGTSDTPVYNFFYDAATTVGDRVELITPARFLFNAGKTPKSWNNKMLNSCNFKIMWYEQNAANVFPNTDIQGGVCIGY